MLGWEFPPHISGGLGTACHGLTVGLARAGVEVLFVVPKALGDEDASHIRLIGANQVRFRRRVRVPREAPAGSTAAGSTAAGSTGESAAAVAVERIRAGATAGESHLWRVVEAQLRSSAGYASPDEIEATMGAAPIVDLGSALSPYADPGAAMALPADLQSALQPWLPTGLLENLVLGGRPFDAPGWRELAKTVAAALRARQAALDAPAAASPDVEYEVEERLAFQGGYGHDLFGEVARFALAVGEIARREQFDVIHAHDWITFPAAAAAAEISGRPVVAHVHASEHDRSGENPNPHVKAIEQLGLDISSRVVCVSHYTASILKRRYRVDAAKLRVIHNAVTQDEQRQQWRGVRHIHDPIVLFLGRVTFQKGPDYFLEAAARVVSLRPDVLFVVSGSGDMLPAMVERSARLGLAKNVYFTGFLRGKDVERMYSMADLYVMPSVSEPFGITPLEAMALDVPVIVSRQSGVSEILTHALKVDFWDVDELANKILAVLEYAPLRKNLAESGRDEVRRMRWELRGELVRDVYKEILQ